jgi:crotonobetainyl-CoA:carnitine CoA-transferase CaiB-like acyl-CoA transferase
MASPTLQTTDVNAIVLEAGQIARDAANAASKSGIGQSISSALINSSSSIQAIINNIMANNGAVTSDELSQLNDQIAIAKLNTLQAQTNNTFSKYGISLGVAIFIVGALWLVLSNKKSKDGQ